MAVITIHTDGACSGNQNDLNLGGWGALLEYKGHTKEIYGGVPNTTNNRMEMLALIKGLEAITKDNQEIHIFSDSSYLIECFRQKWYLKWIDNGWLNSKKAPVENRDLWETLLELIEGHDISFYRVKGHVNLDSPNTDIDKLYNKFVEWNGSSFSRDDFISVTRKNNIVDSLANLGIDSLKQ